ncbi:hypothetical protein HYT60_00965 [Candidatus Woesebacteria bacterium]|nr:hypothetical protein [Candidatus Woesebacteria bacterium]
MKKRGKFIVIEGGDSSGKEVQSKRLIKALRSLGYKVRFLDFPRYNQFHGKVVGRYLAGEFGDAYEVSPWLAAYPYANDRLGLRDSIIESLEDGQVIVSNRYVGSNLGYMSAKLPRRQREDFIRWNEEFEYKRLGLPREDVSIFLYVPARIGQKLTYRKDEKVYMKGKGRGDIHERNLQYLEQAINQFLWLTRNRNHWVRVDSTLKGDGKKLRPAEDIHRDIMDILVKRRIIDRS